MKTNLLNALLSTQPSFHRQRLGSFLYPSHAPQISIDQHATVDLSRVRGVAHPDYAGHSWGSLIGEPAPFRAGRLSRLFECLQDLERNPGYYLDGGSKFDWSFFRVDDELYVTSGHHRTVVARYFAELNGHEPIVAGVTVITLSQAVWVQSQQVSEQWHGDFEPECFEHAREVGGAA